MELLSSPQQFLRRAPHINTKIAEAWGQNGWFRNYRYARANGRDRPLQPDHFPSEAWMDDRRPPGLVYRELQKGTIQLQSL